MRIIVAVILISLLALAACTQAPDPADPVQRVEDNQLVEALPRDEGTTEIAPQEEPDSSVVQGVAPDQEEVEAEDIRELSTEIGYANPGGFDTMILTLQLSDGQIEAFDIEEINVGRTASRYIAEFNQVAPEYLLGKSLDEVELPARLAGASLTSAAFNKAIAGLK